MSEADQPRPSSLITFASPIGYSEGWTRESLAVEVERRASSAGVMRYSGGSCASATRRSICASSAVLNSSGGRRASRLRFISHRPPSRCGSAAIEDRYGPRRRRGRSPDDDRVRGRFVDRASPRPDTDPVECCPPAVGAKAGHKAKPTARTRKHEMMNWNEMGLGIGFGMGAGWFVRLLILALLVFAIAALIKYVRK